MRILLTCDPEIPVPPVLYGGIERIVDGLARGYREKGHEVFLIANPGSTCVSTIRIFSWPALHSRGLNNVLKNMWFLDKVVKEVKPDIIHSFSRLLYGYPVFLKRRIPFVQTYNRRISWQSTALAMAIAGKKLRFTSCAAHMIERLPFRNAFTPVFNFADVNYYVIDPVVNREHVIFLGRIESIKGTKEAILAAIKAKCKIVVAGNIDAKHAVYFQREIEPLLKHPLVHYVGEVNDEQKKYYLQRAKALLFPIKWEEPFGIVLAEALACGTPVIAYNRGSVPEIIKEGFNGFIVESVDEITKSISELDKLDTNLIREDAVIRFSLQNVAKQYLTILEKTID